MTPQQMKTFKIVTIATYTICGAAVGLANFYVKKLSRDIDNNIAEMNANMARPLFEDFTPEAKRVLFGN